MRDGYLAKQRKLAADHAKKERFRTKVYEPRIARTVAMMDEIARRIMAKGSLLKTGYPPSTAKYEWCGGLRDLDAEGNGYFYPIIRVTGTYPGKVDDGCEYWIAAGPEFADLKRQKMYRDGAEVVWSETLTTRYENKAEPDFRVASFWAGKNTLLFLQADSSEEVARGMFGDTLDDAVRRMDIMEQEVCRAAQVRSINVFMPVGDQTRAA